MTPADTLADILRSAPTGPASLSALHCLLALAQDGDFEAIRQLTATLGHHLGYAVDSSVYAGPRSLADFLTTAEIPALLRTYAAGFCPRYFLLDGPARTSLQSFDLARLPHFQRLVRRRSLFEHEALKAFILTIHANAIERQAPGSFMAVCIKVMRQAEVVEGRNASSEFRFGRDLLLDLALGAFVGVVAHELAHNLVLGLWRPSGLSTDRAHLLQFARWLPGLKTAALASPTQPLGPTDPRRIETESGLLVLYTVLRLDDGYINHLSVSDRGGPVELSKAACYIYLMLSTLGIDPAHAALAYSPQGRAHAGFIVPAAQFDAFESRRPQRLTGRALEQMVPRAAAWLQRLQRAGHVGSSEEDLLRLLDPRYDQPAILGDPGVDALDDLNRCEALRSTTDLASRPQADLATLLCAAVRCADPQLVGRLLAAGAPPAAAGPSGVPCLLQAGASLLAVKARFAVAYVGPTAADVLAVMENLFRAGYDVNSPVGAGGDTLLVDAARRGSQDAVRFLCAHGARVGLANELGETALYAASAAGDPDMVSMLLQAGADANAVAHGGRTPLWAALSAQAEDVAQVLLARGAGAARATADGETPLMLAASAPMVAALVAAGADVNQATLTGETALMRAAVAGRTLAVKALLDADADVNAATDLGETALHFAMLNWDEKPRVVLEHMLLEAGADADAQTNDGRTPREYGHH